jgi:hypothetical protein
MRSVLVITVLAVTLPGCPGGDGSIGDSCASQSACRSDLQCFRDVCTERCDRAPECGDGYRCEENGVCSAATGQVGDACESEVDCGIGLACQVEGTATTDSGYLQASCAPETAGRPASATCVSDEDCRNGTCDLGHCIDLCRDTIDCSAGTSCTGIPRIASNGLRYRGCLQSRGSLSWPIDVGGTNEMVSLPIPESARGVSVHFSVEDGNQKVGASFVTSPENATLLDGSLGYYENPWIRHRPDYGDSVLAMPVSPMSPVEAGVYNVRVRSLRRGPDLMGNITDVPGTAIPSMTAVIKLDPNAVLDLHFHFLDLADHPCRQTFGGTLDATNAGSPESLFQSVFLVQLRQLIAKGGIGLGSLTYTDLRDHADLDGLDATNASSLLALGTYTNGINVFFVRTLSPVGLQALAPNPGPAGVAGSRQSGVIIGLDTLCYRSWNELARITTRELARYMGLYPNYEEEFMAIDPVSPVPHRDPIMDSDDSSTNLMFNSELAGSELSDGQRFVLTRSPVLR